MARFEIGDPTGKTQRATHKRSAAAAVVVAVIAALVGTTRPDRGIHDAPPWFYVAATAAAIAGLLVVHMLMSWLVRPRRSSHGASDPPSR